MCLHKEYSSLTFHTSFSFGYSFQEAEIRICDALRHDARSKRQTYPFRVKDQLQTRSYVNNFCQRPSRLGSHSEVSMQNLNFYRNYRLFSLKNTTIREITPSVEEGR